MGWLLSLIPSPPVRHLPKQQTMASALHGLPVFGFQTVMQPPNDTAWWQRAVTDSTVGEIQTRHLLISSPLSSYVTSKVGWAPAAFNFAADTGWDTDWLRLERSWSPKWRVLLFEDVNKKRLIDRYAVVVFEMPSCFGCCLVNQLYFRFSTDCHCKRGFSTVSAFAGRPSLGIGCRRYTTF